MSQLRNETIVCPSCNRRDNIRLWLEIEATKDITAKNRLLDGKLFTYKCKKCGYKAATAYNCMYKDRDKNIMIYFAADGDGEGMSGAMDKVEADLNSISTNGMKYNVRRRIVFSEHSLREKVIIFEAGLDDRIIELMKLFAMSAVAENHPDIEIGGCFFYTDGKELKFEFASIDGRSFATTMSDEMYHKFVDEYQEAINNAGETYFVDNDFAIGIVVGNMLHDE